MTRDFLNHPSSIGLKDEGKTVTFDAATPARWVRVMVVVAMKMVMVMTMMTMMMVVVAVVVIVVVVVAVVVVVMHLQTAHMLRVRRKFQLFSQQPPYIEHNPAHHMHVAAVVPAIP
jgi:hypothetical protein